MIGFVPFLKTSQMDLLSGRSVIWVYPQYPIVIWVYQLSYLLCCRHIGGQTDRWTYTHTGRQTDWVGSRIDTLCVCIPMSFSSLVFCNLLCRPDSFEKRYAAFGAQDDFSYTLKIHQELSLIFHSPSYISKSVYASGHVCFPSSPSRLLHFPQCLFSVPFAISSRIVFTVRPNFSNWVSIRWFPALRMRAT